jgi:predicted NUDIX family NTP pyrophosphohydrolase
MRSCGLLLYRVDDAGETQVWIGHMGGPFWAKRDLAAWSIPKGVADEGEDELAAARREFEEEMGAPAPNAAYERLGQFRQPSGKRVVIFAGETDFDLPHVASNLVPIAWPPRSGRVLEVPEIDVALWFPLDEARSKVVKGQVQVLDALRERLASRPEGPGTRKA